VLPIIVKDDTKAQVLEFAAKVRDALRDVQYHGTPLRVEIDDRDIRGGQKNWEAIKKGIPLRIEIGPKEVEAGKVVVHRRDLPTGTKGLFSFDELRANIVALLDEQQENLAAEGRERLKNNLRTDLKSFAEFKEHFGSNEDGSKRPGWVRAKWCGDPKSLDVLNEFKVTVRCMPLDQSGTTGSCILTGVPATTDVIFARAY
jgi:prolyl-tRNA synthetase